MDYFTWPNQNVIGLAPTQQSDAELLKRQFLYQVTQANPSFIESYLLIGSKELFLLGGSEQAYQAYDSMLEKVLPEI